MSIPNLLTLFRLASAPLFLFFFVGSGQDGFLSARLTGTQGVLICVAIAVLSELSDVLDGILARRLNQVSDFGKVLDPYADSTFRLTVYFSFASQAHGKWIPLWMVMVLLYRDLLVTVIRAFGIERRIFVQARASGKIKAIAQATAAIAVLVIAGVWGPEWVSYHPPLPGAFETSLAHQLMWIVTAVTLWSAFDYAWGNRHLFSGSGGSGKAPPQRAQGD